jgi:NAD(P)-dependent dehydrogenase (short-subunit alcohol dehydrogenase family)
VLAARSDLSGTVKAVEEAAKKAGLPVPKVLSIKVDVTNQGSVEAAAAQIKDEFPEGIDVVVSNAGYLEDDALIAESSAEEWWSSIEINFKGHYLVARSFVPMLLAKRDGFKVICNVVSIGAHMIFPGMSAYNTAKLAVCRLTEYEDAEYGDSGLIAFSIHPGGVLTDMGARLPVEKQKMLTDTIELPSHTIVWLTGKKRTFLRGRYLSCQWDMEQLENHAQEIVDQDLLKVKLDVGNEIFG